MSKPKFDPNQPFQVVDDKPKFDPQKPFEEVRDTPPSQLEALARGAAQGSTLGFSDEMGGAGAVLGDQLFKARYYKDANKVESPNPEVQAKLDAIAATNQPTVRDIYRQGRDEERAANLKAEEAYPKTYLGGQIAGGMATPITRAATGLKGIAATGAALGLGGSEADVTTGDPAKVKRAAIDTGIGAGTSAAVYGAIKAVPKLWGAGGKITSKIGNFWTGVPEEEINTYATQTGVINNMIKESGGNMTVAADKVREKLQTGLRSAKNKLNGQISKVLDLAPTEKTISLEPVIMKLQVAKAKLNPNLQTSEVADIDEILAKITHEGGEGGLVNLRQLQEVKNYLQEGAKSAYLKGGQLFSRGDKAQQASKQAATEALSILNPLAPEIQAANKQLSSLHFIEKNLNKNLIAPGTPEGALLAAGSNPTGRNATMLKGLGELTNQDALGEAKRLAAARTFAKPPLAPVITTGKSVLGPAVMGSLGFAVGGVPGATIATAMTSPMSLKAGLNLGRLGVDTGKAIARAVEAGNTKVFGKYAPIIVKAAKQGPKALALTSSILSAKDPQFKDMLDSLIGGGK